ncbi:MAG: ZIP family metal transporter [Anaerolineae bacterium]|nr:ZIP family metal transporter [Anaerolineae bacterium]
MLNVHPALPALLATLFTWGVTALGAATIYLTRTMNRKLLDAMLGFAGGVMIAASFWSLLSPAIEMAESGPLPSWLPALIGFGLGGLFLAAVDKILPHVHLFKTADEAEGVRTNWQRIILLVLAITMHNIPEGLAVGVAFGAAWLQQSEVLFTAAVALAIGIGLQNFPEGTAVAMPLRGEGFTRRRAFFYGQLSAAVEPIAGVIGALAVTIAQPLLPYALSFAAGAMIFVVIEEVIPESQTNGNSDLATLGTMVGFGVMMLLDVALG